MKLLQAINTLLSTIVILIILSLLGGGVYLGYSLYESSRSAQQVMEKTLAEKEAELAKLSGELKLREEDLQKKENLRGLLITSTSRDWMKTTMRRKA